ncbi:MAG: hypothetical protein E7348_00640 [Clostridiales bacterium]|nr:hypothetical protein [Clostridiales bacterium]
MDNRITKKRLQDLLSYDWLKAVLIVLGVIIAWEFIYSVASVKLTAGQEFKVFFDQNIYHVDSDNIVGTLKDKNIVSYDVLKVGSENMLAEYNLLSTRIEVGEGDIVFTDNKVAEPDGDKKVSIRAKEVVDGTPIYSYEVLLRESKKYIIDNFYKDGVIDISKENPLLLKDPSVLDELVLDLANLDEQKIESVFRQRMKGDNRFRNEEQIKEGIKDEKARIEKLVSDINFFNAFMQQAETIFGQNIFMRYTKYEQSEDFNPGEYAEVVQREKNNGRENAIYGIDMGVLSAKGGDKNASSLVKLKTTNTDEVFTADNVIMMVINLKDEQPHLQYETISFIRYIVQTYSIFKG